MDDQTSSRLQRAAGPVYFLGFLFLALSLMDFVMNVWPLQLGKVNWRYGTFGLAGGFLLTPLLGFLMLMIAGFFYRSRKALVLTGVLCAVTAIGLALMSMSFVLDALQLRSGVQAVQRGVFDAGVIKALIKDLTGTLCAAWIALVSFRGAREVGAPVKRDAPSSLLVGARTAK